MVNGYGNSRENGGCCIAVIRNDFVSCNNNTLKTNIKLNTLEGYINIIFNF